MGAATYNELLICFDRQHATAGGDARKKPTEKDVPAPPARLRRNQINRTIALVVDDLTLTVESSPFVVRRSRNALITNAARRFRGYHSHGSGMGALQMFTADKRILYAAIERVRWSPSANTLYTSRRSPTTRRIQTPMLARSFTRNERQPR